MEKKQINLLNIATIVLYLNDGKKMSLREISNYLYTNFKLPLTFRNEWYNQIANTVNNKILICDRSTLSFRLNREYVNHLDIRVISGTDILFNSIKNNSDTKIKTKLSKFFKDLGGTHKDFKQIVNVYKPPIGSSSPSRIPVSLKEVEEISDNLDDVSFDNVGKLKPKKIPVLDSKQVIYNGSSSELKKGSTDAMNINNLTLEHVTEFFESPVLEMVSKIDYGKMVATTNENYIRLSINKYLDSKVILCDSDLEELKQHNVNVSNNGPGFDFFNTKNGKRYQSKFRQIEGKSIVSRQVHFENTRRLSAKNKNESSKSGHVAYSIDEFDYVLITLCHIKNGVRENYKNWSFSLIPINELIDPSSPSCCLTHIPSDIIEKYYVKDINELCKMF